MEISGSGVSSSGNKKTSASLCAGMIRLVFFSPQLATNSLLTGSKIHNDISGLGPILQKGRCVWRRHYWAICGSVHDGIAGHEATQASGSG